MYESRKHPPVSKDVFRRRLLRHAGAAALIIVGSLLLGMVGYVWTERLSWTDAFLNSAMLLGGMGPVDKPVTEAGKLFAGAFALYAGLVFIVTAGLLAVPVVHRVLHKFHWDEK
jgi:hypothetical protein